MRRSSSSTLAKEAISVIQGIQPGLLEFGKKVLDEVSRVTGWRIVREPLSHPDDPNVCTLDVPGYKQIESYTCGYVAGSIILHTFHPRRSLDRFYSLCQPDYDKGLQTTTLVRALRASGIGVAKRGKLIFSDIQATIESGYPIITLTKTARADEIHWVVIYGVGTSPNRVFIAGDDKLNFLGTWLGRKEVKWEDFQKSIWGQKGFGLVCWGK